MKATLKFSLPEEAEEHRLALDGHKWQAVVSELDSKLRNAAKYQEGPESERAAWARELLYSILAERGVELP
jgi:hypothetical protein